MVAEEVRSDFVFVFLGSGDFYINDLPPDFRSKYFADTAVLKIESYEDLLRSLARKKKGRILLQKLTGKKFQTKEGTDMVILEDC